jgi:hypothetical protein
MYMFLCNEIKRSIILSKYNVPDVHSFDKASFLLQMFLIALVLTCILRLPSDADQVVEDEFLLTDVPENVDHANSRHQ